MEGSVYPGVMLRYSTGESVCSLTLDNGITWADFAVLASDFGSTLRDEILESAGSDAIL